MVKSTFDFADFLVEVGLDNGPSVEARRASSPNFELALWAARDLRDKDPCALHRRVLHASRILLETSVS